jgi:2-polyprenyl-6-methoxyphenol hydroxylase-like FAD-dependent oxidoreductase
VKTSEGADVVIIGAGLVGLVVAMDLAQRGVSVLVVEKRAPGEPPSGSCNHVAARTMETYRRLGIVKQVREAGFPAHYPHDIAFVTTVTGKELSRIRIPSRAERYTARDGPDTGWPTPEPPHRINQRFLNPLLNALARERPGITIVDGAAFAGYTETEKGVLTTIRHGDGGPEEVHFSRYLIGCDGARSSVRRAIGAELVGVPVVGQNIQMIVRTPDLMDLLPNGPAWNFIATNPRRNGSAMAVDGRELWLIRGLLGPDETPESIDRDAFIREVLGVREDFEYKIESIDDFTRRRLVADRFRKGRVFIAGDAAHIWPPTAGYGMNTGVADGMDLSWMISAVIAGWAAPRLLDAYEAERHPLTTQVSHFVIKFWSEAVQTQSSTPPELEEESPAGDAVRAKIGEALAARNTAQYCCKGLNFGYFYDKSPIIAYDAGEAPPFTMDEYTPSTVPGCRAPHLWLEDGRSLFDALGQEYTLLRSAPSSDVEPLMQAAARKGMPLALVDVTGAERAELYPEALVLVRPDGHIAWRGDACPAEPDALIELVTGRAHLETDRRVATVRDHQADAPIGQRGVGLSEARTKGGA